jgi:transposase
MQTKRNNKQGRLVMLPPLEEFIPSDHRLRRLHRVLDLSFVHEAVRDRYCQDNGRPSIDPEVVLRLFLLQAIEGIGQVRELLRQVQVNLAYRWFIGYELDEEIPDHSTLSKALERFGDEIFNQLFIRSIVQCQKSGLIEGKVLHVDATTIRADLDASRVAKADSPDKDARFGRFPGGQIKPGYKQQTVVDDASRVVVGVSVTPANLPDDSNMLEMVDDTIDRLEQVPEAVCADAAYGSGKNGASLAERGVRLVSPPQQPKTYTGEEQFTTEDFLYDKSKDEFVCPAGKRLKYLGEETERRHRRKYAALRSECRVCAWKSCCTRSSRRELKVGVHHSALIELRADSKTESFRTLYRRRAPVIEGVFAEAKQWHGLGRAWRCGLSKMRIQCLLIAAVLNFKRLIASFSPLFDFQETARTLDEAIWRTLEVIRGFCHDIHNIAEPKSA